jgi:hypothetical protein
MLWQRLHHGEDGAVFQKRQLAGAEVVEQRAERFRTNRHLRVQSPAAIGIERGRRPRLRGRGHGQ